MNDPSQLEFFQKEVTFEKPLQQTITQHNTSYESSPPIGSLLSALDHREVRNNVVYHLRASLKSLLMQALPPANQEIRQRFLEVLAQEISLKKITQDPIHLLRNTLLSRLIVT